MDFEFTDVQRAWREKGSALGRELSEDAAAGDVVPRQSSAEATGAAHPRVVHPGGAVVAVLDAHRLAGEAVPEGLARRCGVRARYFEVHQAPCSTSADCSDMTPPVPDT